MFSGKVPPLSPRAIFYGRLRGAFVLWLSVVLSALAIGMIGYHSIAGFDWTDAFLDAAMILSGMGEVNPLPTKGAKVFAGFYALFAGLAVIAATAVMISPILHRALHRFHLDDQDLARDSKKES
jgi:hypothetical protein